MQGEIHILAKLVVVTFTLPGICLHPHPSFMVDFPASHVSFLGDMYLWCQTKKLSISPEKKKLWKTLRRSEVREKSYPNPKAPQVSPTHNKGLEQKARTNTCQGFCFVGLRLDRFVTFASPKNSAISGQFLMLPHYFGVIFC